VNGLLFRLLLLAVVLAPLPLGSNREWAWNLAAVVAAGLSLAWSLHGLLQPQRVSLSLSFWPVALFLGVCAWAYAQTLTLVPVGWAHPLWGLSSEALGDAPAGSVSLAPDDTFTALLRLLSYGLVFFMTYQFCRERQRALEAFRWLVLAGLAYAVYGLIIFWGHFETLLWLFKDEYTPAVHGTFVNRNHFATWLGLTVLCALALLYARVAIRRNPAYQLPVDHGLRLEQFVLQTWKPLMAIIVLTAGLILTHSRGGFFSTLAGVLVLLLLLNQRQRFRSRRTVWVMGSALLVAMLAFWLTSEVLLERIGQMGVDYQSRLQAYRLAADGIEDNPLLGFGYGTFADSFRLYRDTSVAGFFDKTHNTYLENIFELGWPAAMALFSALAGLALICAVGVRRRHRDWAFPATGLAATVLVAIHSAVDFSLQMPATAMLYACIMGVACAQARNAPQRVLASTA